MTSHEEPEEGEQHGGNTVTAAGKPYTRDVHHDTEPAPLGLRATSPDSLRHSRAPMRIVTGI